MELRLEAAVLLADHPLLERALDGEVQLFVDHRLGEIVEGADADRLDRAFDRAVTGEQDDRRLGTFLVAHSRSWKPSWSGRATSQTATWNGYSFHPLDRLATGRGGFRAMPRLRR